MNNYKIYITKAENNYFVAFMNDYNIAVEEKSVDKAFETASSILKDYILDDIKEGKKVIPPAPTSFEQMQSIIAEYDIKGPMIVREVSIPDAVTSSDAFKSERINITLPKYLRTLADQAGLSPSKVAQEALIKKLGL